MISQELRTKFLEFFKSKGHVVIPSASLIPENDPTVLFTTAGMHPLVPYLMGEKHPSGKRVTSVQKCIRTGDIEEVGDATHHTFFEMLGNWSLGDYFKEDSIKWSWEFLTDAKWLNLDKNRLAVSVFIGDEDAPFDQEAFDLWKSLGVSESRIAKLPKKNNWWGPAGDTGPCGPDTEIFYWVGDPNQVPASFNDDNDLWVEIWNNVFMQYNKKLRVLLIDGMGCLYNENFEINEKLIGFINSISARKILVVNGYGDKALELVGKYGIEVFTFNGEIKKDNKDFFLKLLEKYSLKKEDIVYFDHAQNNLDGANESGIKSNYLYNIGDDISGLVDFVKKNISRFEPLAQKNVDTGMGMERTLAALNGLDDNYRTDLFWPIIQKVEELSGKKYDDNKKAMRVISDHIKAATMIIGDEKGVVPSNVGAGYIVRRAIRRAVRYGKILGINEVFTFKLAEVVIDLYKNVYPEVKDNKDFIINQLVEEEEKFAKTLEKGEKEFDKWYRSAGIFKVLKSGSVELKRSNEEIRDILSKQPKKMPGSVAANLFTTYGFPIELIVEIAKEKGIEVDVKGFNEEIKKHQDLSRTASAGMFKGGLADASVETTRLHTAAHLMLEAMRRVLGDHVQQKGSNITAERLRFDFSHPDKMTPEQIKQVEDIVNEQIQKKLPVHFEEMTVDEAKAIGATGVFEHKYGDKVKVYFVGDFSKEICGGPHVTNTGELGHFKIAKEESSSAGVRRVKAVLE